MPAIFTDEVFGCIGAGAASAVLVVAGGLLVGPQAALYGRVLTVAGYAAGCGGVGGVGLVARWRRPAATGVGLTLLAVVAFGPAVQPWYLLWGLVPLGPACTGGIRRVIVFVSAGLSPLVYPNGSVVPDIVAVGFLAITAGTVWDRVRSDVRLVPV